MVVRDFISDFYLKVNPCEGDNFVEEELVENEYLVVTGLHGYVGILTLLDLLKRPHKIVALFVASKSISNKEVSIQYVNPDVYMTICSDRNKIKHILYHLIDNAIKFSTERAINYGYNLDFQSVIFVVTNGGALTDTEDRIFDAFYKQSKNKEYSERLGIGLALAKKMTGLLGGTANCSATKTETTFNVTLSLN